MRKNAIWVRADTPPAAESLHKEGWPAWLGPILARRGVDSIAAAEVFLAPALEQLHDPCDLPDLEPAVELLAGAAERRERVAIVGDYDVDGVSATALLSAVFGAGGLEVVPILPHRMRDGYGFQTTHAERAHAERCTLVVTADCGSTSYEAVAAARALGLAVIVTDHHLPGEPLAEGAMHINPKLPGSRYPFAELCGAGIALKLALAFAERVGRPIDPVKLLRIACLGTIADVVPLVGENRVIAALGLRALTETRSVGLRALMNVSRTQTPLTATDVGYRLGPRLNAAGRMDSPELALELLLSRDQARAEELAQKLDLLNGERRRAELVAVEQARAAVLERDELPAILVASSPEWHRGVVGIAAGRLAREFHRPTVLLAEDGASATGSGRSIKGIDLHGFLKGWSKELERFGGHSQAIGLTVDKAALHGLVERWERDARAAWDEELLRPRYRYDAELTAKEMDHELLRVLALLEPCGADNPQPLFRVGPVELAKPIRHFGEGHASMRVTDLSGGAFDIVAWRWSERAAQLPDRFEVLGRVELDDYTGQPVLRLLDARGVETSYSSDDG